MQKFAFIIHPIDVKRDIAKISPLLGLLPEPFIEKMLLRKPCKVVAHVTGIRSVTGAEAEGWFIGCPLSPRQFVELPVEEVYHRLEDCGRIAEELGAGIIGLGAFSSVAGDGGITLSKRLNIAVTTGNSYTTATAVEGATDAAGRMGIALCDAVVAVVGATGSIGATCAEILARSARSVVLVGRDAERLQAAADRMKRSSVADISATTDIAGGLKNADIVITVSSAGKAIVMPEHIKRGAVVCDVARPRDVSVAVAKARNDVLVIEGGVVRVPGEMRCTAPNGSEFTFGFPRGTAYACMSETIALALDNRFENFTLGKEVSVQQVDEIQALCLRHGFRLDGYRSFERGIDDAEIDRIRRNAGRYPAPAPAAAPAETPAAS
jgi:predicted amino acid dehydrogenase